LLQRIVAAIDFLTDRCGRGTAWLSLALALVVGSLVIVRYLFHTSAPAAQEAALYLHAALFMLGASFTLQSDEHVRVDILYRRLSPRARAWIDCIGTLVFLIPVCLLLLLLSWDYVAASWAVRETSSDPGGLPWVYLLKTLLLLMPASLLLQGVAEFLRRLPATRHGSAHPGRHP
jgi:TRAP-type mannitol/chloroaromatic compound transport system permease small subunit